MEQVWFVLPILQAPFPIGYMIQSPVVQSFNLIVSDVSITCQWFSDVCGILVNAMVENHHLASNRTWHLVKGTGCPEQPEKTHCSELKCLEVQNCL